MSNQKNIDGRKKNCAEIGAIERRQRIGKRVCQPIDKFAKPLEIFPLVTCRETNFVERNSKTAKKSAPVSLAGSPET
eukprot:g52169.t1